MRQNEYPWSKGLTRVSLFNPFQNKPWFLRVSGTSLLKKAGKREIARNEQFLLFPQCFLCIFRPVCHFHQFSKICHLEKTSNRVPLFKYSHKDENLSVAQMIEFIFDCTEKIVGKAENTGHQHFLLFQKASACGLLTVRIVW